MVSYTTKRVYQIISNLRISKSKHFIKYTIVPKSNGLICLFHGAILQSGAGIAPWSVMLEKFGAEDYMYQMADKLGCDNSSMQDIVYCMKQQDAQDIADQDHRVECPVSG